MDSNGTANLKVVDIYHGDGTVDFVQLKNQGYDGVIIKATQGTTFKDIMCGTNYQNAKKAGLNTGFYHYYNINNYNGVEQADFFLNTIAAYSPDYLPVIDVELTDYSKPLPDPLTLSLAVKACLDRVKALYGASMLYSNPATLKQLKASELGSYPLWIAEYDSSSVQDVPGFGPWTGWQFTDKPIDQSKFTDHVFLQNSSPGNPAVLDYQKKLIRLRIGGVQPTGVNDAATKSAVMMFQRIEKLTVDGIWGSQCESAYQSVAAKPKLKYGSSGTAARYVQFCVLTPVDGAFGKDTDAAVKQFQKENGLVQDGIVGPKTWYALIG
jgi:hypothetical protein